MGKVRRPRSKVKQTIEPVRPSEPGLVVEAFKAITDLPRPKRFLIKGTSPVPDAEGHQLSDVAMTNLLSVHMATINGGKVLIWQRYNVMLTANSILLGLTAQGKEAGTARAAIHIVGILLCAAWFLTALGGWAYSTKRLRIVSRFKWETLGDEANPGSKVFAPVVDTGLWYDHIFLASLAVIILFLVAHAWLLTQLV